MISLPNLFFTSLTALSITVSVFSPRKSNLMRSTSSRYFRLYCVTKWSSSAFGWRKSGVLFHSSSFEMTTPAACMPAFRFRPSRSRANFQILFAFELLAISSPIFGSFSKACSSVMPSSSGMSLAIASASA